MIVEDLHTTRRLNRPPRLARTQLEPCSVTRLEGTSPINAVAGGLPRR